AGGVLRARRRRLQRSRAGLRGRHEQDDPGHHGWPGRPRGLRGAAEPRDGRASARVLREGRGPEALTASLDAPTEPALLSRAPGLVALLPRGAVLEELREGHALSQA